MENEDAIIKLYKEMKSIKEICDNNEINYSNVINGVSSIKNKKIVVKDIKIEIFKIYSKLLEMEDSK